MAEGKNPVGRPPAYSSPEEMQIVVDEYFLLCKANDEPPTVSGLALALDISTEGVRRYEGKPEFRGIVKRAKQQVENALEKRLHQSSPVGAIFNLKANFGWVEKSVHEVTGPNGGPLQATTVDPSELSTSALKEILAARREAE